MKRNISIGLLGLFISLGLFGNGDVHAQTTDNSSASSKTAAELQAQIMILMKQVQELQTKLRATQNSPTGSGTLNQGLHLGEIRKNICFGAKNDDDVRILQAKLKESGHFKEDVTGNFGRITAEAVMNFQREKGIPPVNCVGPLTRAAIQASRMGTSADSVASPILPNSLPAFRIGVLSAVRLTALNLSSSTEINWTIVQGSLPSGLNLIKTTPVASCAQGAACLIPHDKTTTIQGEPTTPGNYRFIIRASDGTKSVEREYELIVTE